MAGGRMISFRRTEKYSTKVAEELRSIREENTFTDFTILTNGSVIPCHKLQLALHSPVLKAMLMTNMEEAAKQEVRLDHISKDIMEIILDYMYYGDENFHSDQLMDLITACNYLQMTELMELCVAEVPASLEASNVLPWWIQADKMDLHTIKSKCEKMMAAEFREVTKQPDFLALSHTLLQLYLGDVCDDSTESDHVLDGIMRWTEHDMDGRLVHLDALIQLVKLSNCTIPGIKSVIRAHDAILDQQFGVFKQLNNTLMDLAESVMKSKEMMLVVGGQLIKNDASPVVWTLSQSNQIEEFCKIPFESFRSHHSVCKIPAGFVITGGGESDICIMFIAATRTWVRMQDMLIKRLAHGSICVQGVVVVLGGYDCTKREGTSSVDLMVIEEGQWQQGPELPMKVAFPKVSDLDGSIYMLDSEKTNQLLCVDMTQRVWNKLVSLPVTGPCHGASMTSARQRLYVAGGEQRLCACYNPSTNTWCRVQPPLYKHRYGSVVHYNDKLLLLGGKSSTCYVEEYNMDDNTWSKCSNKMPAQIYCHTALVLNIPPP